MTTKTKLQEIFNKANTTLTNQAMNDFLAQSYGVMSLALEQNHSCRTVIETELKILGELLADEKNYHYPVTKVRLQ